MAFVYFLKTKDEVFSFFKAFKTLVENQTGRKLKVLRSDNGTEFCSKEFENFLQLAGIVHQKTCAYTPEQNGLCERYNRTIVEKARCLLFDAGLKKCFWAEAVNTAVYLRNRSIASGLDNKTPIEIWTGTKPDVSNLRIFGSKAMVHIPKEKRLKLDRKATDGILVGYSDNIKGHQVYNPKNNKVTIARDIVVIEEGIDQKQEVIHINISEGTNDIFPMKEEREECTQEVGNMMHTKPEKDQEQKEVLSLKESHDTDGFEDSEDVLAAEPAEPVPARPQLPSQPRHSPMLPVEMPAKRLRKQTDRYGFGVVCEGQTSETSASEISLN
ncbi:unnamed protein product [Pieris macdunnoughi]|nr:unnamed protein product [Pieris macdunnoughi]